MHSNAALVWCIRSSLGYEKASDADLLLQGKQESVFPALLGSPQTYETNYEYRTLETRY